MSHNAVSDVVCVQLGCGRGARSTFDGGYRRERVLFPDGTYTPDDLWPGNSLNVFLGCQGTSSHQGLNMRARKDAYVRDT